MVVRLQVLNELVMDRGMSPFLTSLDFFCDDNYVTNVQARARTHTSALKPVKILCAHLQHCKFWGTAWPDSRAGFKCSTLPAGAS